MKMNTHTHTLKNRQKQTITILAFVYVWMHNNSSESHPKGKIILYTSQSISLLFAVTLHREWNQKNGRKKQNDWAINNNKWRNFFKHKKWTLSYRTSFFSSRAIFLGNKPSFDDQKSFYCHFFREMVVFSVSLMFVVVVHFHLIGHIISRVFAPFSLHSYAQLNFFRFSFWEWSTRQKNQHNHLKCHNLRPFTSLNQLGEC